jgi:hypothetical protein
MTPKEQHDRAEIDRIVQNSRHYFSRLTALRESSDFSTDTKQQEWVDTLHRYGNAKFLEELKARREKEALNESR